MAKYRVKEGCLGYINDRMETEGNVFEGREGLYGSWFEQIEGQNEAPAEVASAEPEAQDKAMEDAAAEGEGTMPAEQLVEAEVAASDTKDDGVETL